MKKIMVLILTGIMPCITILAVNPICGTIQALCDTDSIPVIATKNIDNVTPTTATCGGDVISDGGATIISRGVCWSTSPNPDITNNITVDGDGVGMFVSNLTGLLPNTTYYIRAYATNKAGVGYGNEVSFTTVSQEIIYGSVTDVEENVYKTVQIGSQTWMAENLRTTKYRDGRPIPNIAHNSTWNHFNMGAYCWYDHDDSYRNPYGALYNWHVISTGNICPIGWHVPSHGEWNLITEYLGGMHVAGGKMKVTGNEYWSPLDNGATNETGFSGLPGGQRNIDGTFLGYGNYCTMWVSTPTEQPNVYQVVCARTLNSGTDLNGGCGSTQEGHSIRCVKDSDVPGLPIVTTTKISDISQNSANSGVIICYDGGSKIKVRGLCWDTNKNPDTTKNRTIDKDGTKSFAINMYNLEPNTTYYVRAYAENNLGLNYGTELSFKTIPLIIGDSIEDKNGSTRDIEGNCYKTIKIGTQTWMAENLRTTKLNDGTIIPLVSENTIWLNMYSSAYCWLYNDSTNKNLYGALYNYYPIETKKICPIGWHVPINEEWNTLQSFLGDSAVGGKLKEAGYEHWPYPNKGATNSSGFTALPSRTRMDNDPGYFPANINACWWSDSPNRYWYVTTESDDFFEYGISSKGGLSVRCVNDTSNFIAKVPKLTTDTVLFIDKYSAICFGRINNDIGSPITSKGICWSYSPQPDTSNNKTMNGSGTGYFMGELKDLLPKTKYYVRAYAVNYAGVGYGNELSFVTLYDDSVDIKKGLFAWYPFNGNALDESGNNHHGEVNGATLTTDRFKNPDKAYYFDGQGNSISVSDLNLPSNSITVSCWVKVTNPVGIQNFISKHHDSGDVELLIRSIDNKYAIEWTIGNTYFTLEDYNGYFTIDPDHSQFDFITLTYDGKKADLYVNSQIIATKSISGQIANNSLPMVFGKYAAEGIAEFFRGSLDDIRVYNRALNHSEVIALYNEKASNEFVIVNSPAITTFLNNTFEIPVCASNIKSLGDVLSCQFDFLFDPQKLQFQDCISDGTIADSGSIQVNQQYEKLIIAWAGHSALTDSGTIIRLQFKALESGTVTPGITNFLLNTDTVRHISNGAITIIGNYGDVDDNKAIQAYDAALALQYSVGLDPLPDIDPLPWEDWRITAGNVDGKNIITAYDASLILQYVVGLIHSFPVQGYLKSTGDPQADVSVKFENENLVFRSSGDLKGLNVTIKGNPACFGSPQKSDTEALLATNYSSSCISIGLAMAKTPPENDIVLKIPLIGIPDQSSMLNLLVNNQEKQINLGLMTRLSEISENAVEMYPNPAKSILYFKNLPENVSVSVFDVQGRKIKTCIPKENQVDISELAIGLYSIQIKSSNKVLTKKFIKH